MLRISNKKSLHLYINYQTGNKQKKENYFWHEKLVPKSNFPFGIEKL